MGVSCPPWGQRHAVGSLHTAREFNFACTALALVFANIHSELKLRAVGHGSLRPANGSKQRQLCQGTSLALVSG